MSEERIDIVVEEKADGSRVVKRNLDQLADAAQRTWGSLKNLASQMRSQGTASQASSRATDDLRNRMSAFVSPSQQVTNALAAQVRQLQALRNASKSTEYQDLLRQQTALKREIQSIQAPTQSLTQQFWAMRAALVGVAASLGVVYSGLKLADQLQTLENRLRSTGVAGEDLKRVEGELFKSANDTRSSISGTVELYARLSRSSRELGVNESQLIDFTTSLNQAILLSGATSQEAQAGLIQLSQGMASGTLRGDELRSVLEQLPEVADVIAKHFGVTRGALREMGSEGKITAKDIVAAFAKAKDELAARFADLTPTAGQAFTVLRNKMLELVGGEGKGGISQVSAAIMDLSNSLVEFKPLMQAVGFVVQSTIQIFRVAFQALMGLVGGTIPLLLSSLARAVTEIFEWVVTKVSGFMDRLVAITGGKAPDVVLKLQAGLKSLAESAGGVNDYLGQVQKDSLDYIVQTGKNILDVYRVQDEAEKKAGKKPPPPPPAGLSEQELAAIRSGLISLVGQYDRVWAAQQRFHEGVATLERAEAAKMVTEEQSIRIQNLMFKALEDELDPLAALNRQLKEREVNLKLTSDQLAINNEVTRVEKDLQAKGLVLGSQELGQLRSKLEFLQAAEATAGRQSQLKQSIQGPAKDTANTVADLVALREQGQLTAVEARNFAAKILENNKLTYGQMAALRQADLVSEGQVSQRKRAMWIAENQARYSVASATLGNLATLSQSTNQRVAAAGKAFAVAQATIDGVLAVQKALASAPPPWNFALAASVGVATAVNVAKISEMPGFAFGGDFTVGGQGGTDSQVVAFRATPGEKVSVKTPTQEGAGASAVQGSGGPMSLRIVNVKDPAEIRNFMRSSDGEQVIVNIMQENAHLLRVN